MQVFLHSGAVRNDKNPQISDTEFLIYTGLRLIIGASKKEVYCISLNQIIAELFGTLSISRRLKTDLRKAFISITDDRGLVKVVKELDNNQEYYLLKLDRLFVNTDHSNFVIITDDEIRKILNIKFNGHIETVFRYYCVIISTLNNYDHSDVGSMALYIIRDLIDSVNTEMTQLKYNKLLEENRLLYIHHNNFLVHKGKSIEAIPNFYGRYEDKDKVDEVATKKYAAIKNPVHKKKKVS